MIIGLNKINEILSDDNEHEDIVSPSDEFVGKKCPNCQADDYIWTINSNGEKIGTLCLCCGWDTFLDGE